MHVQLTTTEKGSLGPGQVAHQLRSSTKMPVGPETDAYVAMLCKKAEKMNAKLMDSTSPSRSPTGASRT